MVKKGIDDPAFPAWLYAAPFAHRGLHDSAAGRPENTLAAITAAAAAGYGIELDVQTAADGTAMVFHDDNLGRLTRMRGRLAAFPAAALGALRIDGGSETIPTLGAVLECVAGRVPVLIDLKNKGLLAGAMERSVGAAIGGYDGKLAVMVWNPLSMAWMRRHCPGIPVGHIVTGFRWGGRWPPLYACPAARWLPGPWFRRPDFVAIDSRLLDGPRARRIRTLGLPLLTWTVNSPAREEAARRLADNIIFETIRPPLS